jgi:hypothetical protein
MAISLRIKYAVFLIRFEQKKSIIQANIDGPVTMPPPETAINRHIFISIEANVFSVAMYSWPV